MIRLLGVSILSFKEAKGTFLTPVRGNINSFFQDPFCMVQMKLHVNFQSPRWSESAPDRNQSTLLTLFSMR